MRFYVRLKLRMPLPTSIFSGLLWGILGSLATQNTFGPISWFVAPLGMLIGLLVYWFSRRFYSKSLWMLIPVSLISTVLAVALFGLCIGLIDLSRAIPHRTPWAVIVQAMGLCLIGLIAIPIYWLLFPLSFANHFLIRHLTRRTQAEQGAPSNR
jgi:surface polysaccharide O-acyltransferase-like enzyme